MVLDEFRRPLGFMSSSVDQCVYVRSVNDAKTILAGYVDDIVILSDTVQSMQDIKDSLKLQISDERSGTTQVLSRYKRRVQRFQSEASSETLHKADT